MKVSSLGLLKKNFVGIVLFTAKEIFAASCGGGNRGDGVCSNGRCCSKWGRCVTHSESCGYSNSYQPTMFPTLVPTAITVERMTDVRKLKFNMTLATSTSGTIDTKEFSGIMETHLRILLQENLQQWPKGDVNYDAVVVTLNAFVVMAEEMPVRHLSSITKEPFKTHIHALGRAILPANTPMLFLNEVPAMIASAFDEEEGDEFLKRLNDAKDPILRSSIQVWKGFSDSHYNYMLSNHSPSPSLVVETKDTSVTNYSSSTSGYDKKVEKKEKLPLDYTVFGIVVLTLSMLLIVEVLRHSLDVKASGNLFFETVLELMYRELTTLGVVEFILYLMHRYHPNFNYSLEAVFIDVHFLLSYTAIFNAIQSVFLRMITSRRVEKAWVHTENVEISHYVAIRKEFELVERKLKQLRYNHDDTISIYSETETQDGRFSTRTKFSNWSQRIRHPNLTRRKYKLLVPIRFHELRVHLIAQNNLPRKFKVSYYLKSSLTSTLLEFVHISFFAWIMLMMTVNLIYFASGIIMTFSKSQSTLSEFLVGTFIGIMTLFWVLALLLFFKMKETFEHILTMRLPNENTHKGRRNSQLSLFWGGNPRFVIILTQFMQFGFALGLAGCVTYWKELMSFSYAHMNLSWMLLVVVASYVIFQPLLADILEWYTLCTNMGQLVNMERLHKALAKHKMDEEIRKQKSREEEKTIEDAISRNLRGKREFDRTIDNDVGGSALSLSQLVQMPTKDLPEIQLHETNVQHLVRFFEGYRYQTLSLLIGPMTCFFFIGMRIQGFAVAEGILSNDLNKFQLSLTTTFWLETACYCWMSVELLITLAVFVRNGNRQGILAATLGMILNIICLSLLMIAETMRCCSNKGFGELGYMAFAEHTASCCSKFGERTYGGLGHVEPFTSLIALSPLRYLVAGIIFPVRPGPNHEHKPNNDSNHHGSDPIDRSRALWYATVATHSDLAEKYGMFSSQILCAMLGIDMPVPKSQETCIDHLSDPKDSKCAMESSTRSQCSYGDVSARSTPDNLTRGSPSIALENDIFDYPAARLVLDVCRCECKLLPLLEEWILVDVMLTSHELVICGVRSGECSPDAVVEVLRESIGLRLRDVAKGRSIVSQFSLDDIDNLNIEQRLSVLADEKFDDYESNHPGGRDSNDELDLSEHSIYVNESHLKIHFTNGCGTVLLRFLADMNEEKRNLCNWLLADVGTQAKLWCQTIARLRGETNLRMTRSHFHSKGGIDELEDFIQVRERPGKKQRKSIHERWEHRRTTSTNRLSNLKGLRGAKFT